MTSNRSEPAAIEQVRRWRSEAHAARQKMTVEEQRLHDRQVAERLGLGHLPTMTPTASTPVRKAG